MGEQNGWPVMYTSPENDFIRLAFVALSLSPSLCVGGVVCVCVHVQGGKSGWEENVEM